MDNTKEKVLNILNDLIKKADEAQNRSLSQNENIYHRAQKEAYIELEKRIRELWEKHFIPSDLVEDYI